MHDHGLSPKLIRPHPVRRRSPQQVSNCLTQNERDMHTKTESACMLQLLCPTWKSTVVTSRMAHPAILQTYKIIITRYKHISFQVRDRQVSKFHGCCECPYPGPLKLPPGSEAGYHFHLYIGIGGRYDFHNTCRRDTAATFHELVES